jgi:hypothetical protein
VSDPRPGSRLRLELDPFQIPRTIAVGETAWAEVKLASPGKFEGVLRTTSSHSAVVPLTEERTIWLPASGLEVRACVELVALEACDEPVEITIKVVAQALLQQASWTLSVSG